jgi:hypothetical protein
LKLRDISGSFGFGVRFGHGWGKLPSASTLPLEALDIGSNSATRVKLASGDRDCSGARRCPQLPFSLLRVLYERRAFGLCALYTITSVVLSVGALFAGLYLVRRMVGPAM